MRIHPHIYQQKWEAFRDFISLGRLSSLSYMLPGNKARFSLSPAKRARCHFTSPRRGDKTASSLVAFSWHRWTCGTCQELLWKVLVCLSEEAFAPIAEASSLSSFSSVFPLSLLALFDYPFLPQDPSHNQQFCNMAICLANAASLWNTNWDMGLIKRKLTGCQAVPWAPDLPLV